MREIPLPAHIHPLGFPSHFPQKLFISPLWDSLTNFSMKILSSEMFWTAPKHSEKF